MRPLLRPAAGTCRECHEMSCFVMRSSGNVMFVMVRLTPPRHPGPRAIAVRFRSLGLDSTGFREVLWNRDSDRRPASRPSSRHVPISSCPDLFRGYPSMVERERTEGPRATENPGGRLAAGPLPTSPLCGRGDFVCPSVSCMPFLHRVPFRSAPFRSPRRRPARRGGTLVSRVSRAGAGACRRRRGSRA